MGSGSTTGGAFGAGTAAPSTASTSHESRLDDSKESESAASASAGSLKEGLKDTARTAGGALREQATQLATDIGHELGKTGDSQIQRGAEAIRRFARAIDNAANELEGQSPTVARSAHEAADRVKGLSDNVSNRNISELLESATQLARTQPGLFLGGSVFAGFAMARFLKSSAHHRSESEAVGRSGQMPPQPSY